MPMRGELILPARSRAWKRSAPKSVWRLISDELQSPDLQAILIFVLIGLLACMMMTQFLPFSADIAAGLSQLS
jgi:hypothetical protein